MKKIEEIHQLHFDNGNSNTYSEYTALKNENFLVQNISVSHGRYFPELQLTNKVTFKAFYIYEEKLSGYTTANRRVSAANLPDQSAKMYINQ